MELPIMHSKLSLIRQLISQKRESRGPNFDFYSEDEPIFEEEEEEDPAGNVNIREDEPQASVVLCRPPGHIAN